MKTIVLSTQPVYDAHNKFYLDQEFRIKVDEYFLQNIQYEQYKSLENFQQSTHIKQFFSYSLIFSTLNSMKQSEKRMIIGTGVSVSATSDATILRNIRPCSDMSACPAFGPKVDPKLRGDSG